MLIKIIIVAIIIVRYYIFLSRKNKIEIGRVWLHAYLKKKLFVRFISTIG